MVDDWGMMHDERDTGQQEAALTASSLTLASSTQRRFFLPEDAAGASMERLLMPVETLAQSML